MKGNWANLAIINKVGTKNIHILLDFERQTELNYDYRKAVNGTDRTMAGI